jgi:hypothetical protein
MNARKSQVVLIDRSSQLFGVSGVETIRARLLQTEGRDIEYADIAQMSDILQRFRRRMRNMVHMYRCWQLDYARERDLLDKTYSAQEGLFIRRQLQDSWRLYVTVNKDYHAMRRYYLANLRQPPHYRAAA